ncbi:glycosyltransferase family 4 protein [bacterium]|nr:glycosyltransferase family 4 protein [bacterium]
MKLCFVVQRYGPDISGGAEQHARMLAQQLKQGHCVEVVTTCARDYETWANNIPAGQSEEDGISVRRFPTDFERTKVEFDRLTATLLTRDHSLVEEIDWLVQQGPYSEQLFHFLRQHHQDYDFLFFYTYLYVTSVFGLMIAPEKSLLIPTAHDEPVISFNIFNALFRMPRGIMFLTEAEKAFVIDRFQNGDLPSALIGTGLEPIRPHEQNSFREKHNLNGPFVLYLGRVDEGKGCRELIDFFLRFLEREQDTNLTLVLAGSLSMPPVTHPQIIMPGFISEYDKECALSEAAVVVSPSRYESLSLLVLDAFNAGTPVLALDYCPVVREHIHKSGAGCLYQTYDDFHRQLKRLLKEKDLRLEYGRNGQAYIERFFRWHNVVRNVQNLLTALKS